MARAIWSGSISFGLVNIPVRLVTAVHEKRIHFHMLTPEGDCRLRRKLYCPETGREYDFKDTARGYEVAPDQYVLIEEDELAHLRPEAGRTIEITEFIELADVDPVYFDRPYYLEPGENGARSYRLLVEAMAETRQAAIAHFVMRQREYLAMLRPRDGAIVLHTMHYADEVVDTSTLDLPHEIDLPQKEIKVAHQLIAALAETFDPSKYHDAYREQLEDLIERKAEGEEIVTAAAEEPGEAPRVINLMEALEKSLREAKKQAGRRGGGRKRKSA